MNTHLAIAVVWASLMFSTPISIVALWAIPHTNGQLQKRLPWGCAIVLTIVITSLAFHVSFSSLGANVLVLVLAYGAYCYFAVLTWRIKQRLTRYAALSVMHIPVALGYGLGTVGFLGLMFIVGDKTEPPKVAEQLTPTLTCEIHDWGMAISDSGYTVDLNKHWSLLPFLEKTVYSVVVNETESVVSGEGTDCRSAFAAYQRKGQK